jgi:ATP-dependent Clp protease adaptor protein ClpS
MDTALDHDVLQDISISEKTNEDKARGLILLNDDHNTFDFVIESLMEVCEHDILQAEQCTIIVHYNGKCTVKMGSYKKLNPLRTALTDRGLSAVIE